MNKGIENHIRETITITNRIVNDVSNNRLNHIYSHHRNKNKNLNNNHNARSEVRVEHNLDNKDMDEAKYVLTVGSTHMLQMRTRELCTIWMSSEGWSGQYAIKLQRTSIRRQALRPSPANTEPHWIKWTNTGSDRTMV